MLFEKSAEIIKNFEGFVESAYKCPAGAWTIGYGLTYYPGMDGHKSKVSQGDIITKAKAEEYLIEIISDIYDKITPYIHVEINENQINSILSFCYNVGVNAFTNSTLLKFLNEGKNESCALEFYRWVYANKKILNGLIIRRYYESKLFLSPV